MNKQTTSAFIAILGLASTVVQAFDYPNHCSSGNVIKREYFEDPGTYYSSPVPRGRRYFEFNNIKIEISEGGNWQPLFQSSYGAPGLQFFTARSGAHNGAYYVCWRRR